MISTRVLHKTNFGCLRFVISIAVLSVCLAGTLSLGAFQRRAAHKLRAMGLLEINPETGGERLVPIAILDGGRFHDAGIYEPRPRPMALADGVVYEAQTNGMPAGYFTVTGGKKVQETWIGEGIWIPGVASSASKSKSAGTSDSSKTPAGDDRPILKRPDSNATPTGTTPDSTKPPAPATAPPPDDDRPVLHRPNSNPTPAGSAPPDSAKAPSPAVTVPPTSSQPEASQEDPDRPKLRRGGDSTPAKSGGSPASPQGNAPSPQSGNVRRKDRPFYVAVSDAEVSYPRSYEFTWKPGELPEAEERMRRLAIAQIAPQKAEPPHAPAMAGKTAKGRPVKSRPPELPELTNVMIRAFDLEYANDAVLVLTAEYSLPTAPIAAPAAGASVGLPAKPPTRYIALIARLNGQGELVKISSSLTDSSRLDVAPRMELIDAVDAEGDGIGELLFREYSFDQKSFVIYRIGRSTITTLFEGAAQPLP